MKTLELLRLAHAANRPAYLTGAPGVGKSDMIRALYAEQWADVPDASLTVIHASQISEEELAGIPYVLKGRMAYAAPLGLPDGPGVLFFDELDKAARGVQAAMLSVLLDRQLSGVGGDGGTVWRAHPELRVIAAGNRAADRSGSNTLSAAMCNRMLHIAHEVNAKAWLAWATSEGLHKAVIAYVRLHPERLVQDAPIAGAFATPRSFHMLSDVMHAMGENWLASLNADLVKMCIGEEQAATFTSFARVIGSIPPWADIVDRPMEATIPTLDSGGIDLLTRLFVSRADGSNLSALMAYMARINGRPGQVMLAAEIQRSRRALAKHPALIKVMEDSEYM